jgi:predicted Mrr-cat superfamily restriction endonuclease
MFLVKGRKTEDGLLVTSVNKMTFNTIRAQIARNPELIYGLHWRELEELVAAIYHTLKWTVILTPRSGDGGRDVIASSNDEFGFGSVRYLIEVKQNSPTNPVKEKDVRALVGVVCMENANKGIIITTSRFAKGVGRSKLIRSWFPRIELWALNKLVRMLVSV